MITKLPKSIETYFHAINIYDSGLFSECFTEDAVVEDEGKEYHGLATIKEWIEESNNKLQVKTEVNNVVEQNDKIVVTAKIDGNFDKTGFPDPLLLDFHFTIKEDKIAGLTILFIDDK
jgi:hypothetical protein